MTAAFQKASASLTLAEHAQADAVWKQLQPKYGDAVTRPRMISHYQIERRNVTGSRVGFVGNITVCLPDGSEVGPLVPIAEPVPEK